MTIKKCDRCGAVIPDRDNSGKTIDEVIRGAVKALSNLINPCPDYKITRYGMPVDLCDKCSKAFTKWLNRSEGVK